MHNKKGSVMLTAVLIVLALGLTTGIYLVSDNTDNSITGAMVGTGYDLGIQTISTCNVSVRGDILNIGHDYECNGSHGFIFETDDVLVDCQNHSITCVDNCDGMNGMWLNDVSGVTIRNCRIYNFSNGFLLNNSATANYLGPDNLLINNTDGFGIENATLNNITHNIIQNNTACGINTTSMNNAGGQLNLTANLIYDNKIYQGNTENASAACSDSTSYNYWNAGRSYGNDTSVTNIIGGPWIAGNYWSDYNGVDNDGDFLGDTNVPHKGGGILAENPIGDNYPLVETTIPGLICGNVTLGPENYTTDDGGEGFAIICDGSELTCNGTRLIGNGEDEDHMRGIEISGVDNVAVRGCDISNFTYGIYIRNANNLTIEENIIHDNTDVGIYLGEYSQDNVVKDNEISNTFTVDYPNNQSKGIWLRSADTTANGGGRNNITGNQVWNQTYAGIVLTDNSDLNYLENNLAYDNQWGMFINESTNNYLYSNTLHNNSYGLRVYDVTDITFGSFNDNLNNTFRNNANYGVKIESSSSSSGVVGEFYGNQYGLYLDESSVNVGDSQKGNSLFYENTYGVYLSNSDDVGISRVSVYNNSNGLQFDYSDGTYFVDDGYLSVYNNTLGIALASSTNSSLSSSGYYVDLFNNSRNLQLIGSNGNNISGLRIYGASEYGLRVYDSSNSLIYNNNFTDNNIDAIEGGTSSSNNFNVSKSLVINNTNIVNGENYGGNYWADFDGDDLTGDGIADTGTIPWTSSNNLITGDYLPLIAQAGNVSCGELTHSAELSENITTNGSCINITQDNVVLNCMGYTITGDGTGNGIFVNNVDGVSLIDCNLNNFSIGIHLNNSNNGSILSNNLNNSNRNLYITGNNTNITSNVVFGNTALSSVYLSGDLNTLQSNNISGVTNLINLTNSNNNTITSNRITGSGNYGMYLTSSSDSLIYNNYFNNTINVYDTGNNNWNTSYNCSAGPNILGDSCIGGNFWMDYGSLGGLDDGNGAGDYNATPWNISNDGVGDNLIPFNSSNNISNSGDYLPLVQIPVSCGDVSSSITLTEDLTSNGTCLTVTASNITINLGGYTITGDGTGTAIDVTNQSNVLIQNGIISNFSKGIFVDPSTAVNVSGVTINFTTKAIEYVDVNSSKISSCNLRNNTWGVFLNNSNLNTIYHNNITGNTYGLEIVSSINNTIYDNNFTNINNALDDTSVNFWNVSYTSGTSIIGEDHYGGNYWSDYEGKDLGSGATSPYNETGDGIGDTRIPYTGSGAITGGDYLPLTLDTGSVGNNCIEITEDSVLNETITCDGEDGITIAGDDITLDCNGQMINGTGVGAGIAINDHDNIIIKNCHIMNFYYGIKLLNTNNVQIIEDNNITENDFYGVYVYQSNSTTINDSVIYNDNNGIYMISSQDTLISNNEIDLNKKFYGIYSYGSSGNVILNNNLTDNYQGIYFVNSDNANVTSNLVTDNDQYNLFLHTNSDSGVFDSNTLAAGKEGMRIKGTSSSNTFSNNLIENNTDYGIYSIDSSSNTFVNNELDNNSKSTTFNVFMNNSASYNFTNNTFSSGKGLSIWNSNSLLMDLNSISSTNAISLNINTSSNVDLINNTILTDFKLDSSSDADVINNSFSDEVFVFSSDGLEFDLNDVTNDFNVTDSDTLTITNNTLVNNLIVNSASSTIADNTLNILNLINFSSGSVGGSDVDDVTSTAFNFVNVDSTNIYDNNIQDTTVAIFLNDSDSNTIYDNWLKNNGVGLNITGGSGSEIYNNYFQNTVNVRDDTGNIWKMSSISCTEPNIVGGPCKGGNFYDDYYGLDNGASGRDQGDGIGDEPAYYTISSSSVQDTFPLVLYVARQYFHPDDTTSESFTATGSVSGTLTDGEVVPNEYQDINYSLNGQDYLEMGALFNETDFDASAMILHVDENRTYINKTDVTGEDSSYNAYVYHDYRLDAGLYVCPNIGSLNATMNNCSNNITFTTFPSTQSGVSVSASDNYYYIENLTYNAAGVGLVVGDDVCGANIYHDVTLSENVTCEGTALNANASSITIDLAGYQLSGNGSEYGVYIRSANNVTVTNGTIFNFSQGIYIWGSDNNSISLITFNNNTYGVGANYGADDNNINSNWFLNNSRGINFASATNNNLLYNNYFNNTINAFDNGDNNWSLSSTTNGSNIINGSQLGGNFWSDYSGWDVNLDGFGETGIPHNGSMIQPGYGDLLPLTGVGQFSCGGELSNPHSVTLNRNLTATSGGCIVVTASNVDFDCAGHTVSGNLSSFGLGFNITSVENVTLRNCVIQNFTANVALNNADNSLIYNNTILDANSSFAVENSNGANVTLNTINNSVGPEIIWLTLTNNSFLTNNYVYDSNGVFRVDQSFNNTMHTNTLIGNEYGINLTDSANNTIYNNYFNNTNWNAFDAGGNNFWNTTYNCSIANFTNVVGGDCQAGNFWANYASLGGVDTGNGSYPYNVTPWNISGDGVGDNDSLIPFNLSGMINVTGDYLPLIYTGPYCGDGNCNNGESCSSCVADCGSCSSSGSPGGSSGGSGGGGGGSSSSTTTIEENCTESWSCTSWSDCESGEETRTCTDANDCGTEDNKPDETQDCEVEVIYIDDNTTDTSGSSSSSSDSSGSSSSSSTTDLEVIEEPVPTTTLALSSLAVLFAFGGVYVYWEFLRTSSRVRRRLKKTKAGMSGATVEALKNEYKGIYGLYLKLSNKEKRNFYSNVNKLREDIESQLRAEKIVEKLFEKSEQGSITNRKKTYLKIYKEYQKLAPKSQQKYYQKIVGLREELEKGKK